MIIEEILIELLRNDNSDADDFEARFRERLDDLRSEYRGAHSPFQRFDVEAAATKDRKKAQLGNDTYKQYGVWIQQLVKAVGGDPITLNETEVIAREYYLSQEPSLIRFLQGKLPVETAGRIKMLGISICAAMNCVRVEKIISQEVENPFEPIPVKKREFTGYVQSADGEITEINLVMRTDAKGNHILDVDTESKGHPVKNYKIC